MAILSDKDISALCKNDPPLIRNFFNWEQQLQPSGFDLTIETVYTSRGAGVISVGNGVGTRPEETELSPDADAYFFLKKGFYIVLLNEYISLPNNLMAISHPRSTLSRFGAVMTTGLWDAGFEGRSRVGLFVANEDGIQLQKNALLFQLSFHELSGESMGFQYNHLYKV